MIHRPLVAVDGRQQDPIHFEFDEDHLEDNETLSEAITGLLHSKPHLAARKPCGDVGQGAVSGDAGSVGLAALLRVGAN